jgi:hypothetical protein
MYRKGLSLIEPDGEHASIYMHVQGNLGALLLSADRPSEAVTEFEGALKLGQALEQQLKQQIKQHKKKQKGQKQQLQQQQVRTSIAMGWVAGNRLNYLTNTAVRLVRSNNLLCFMPAGNEYSK